MEDKNTQIKGTLFIVSTPIGNKDDITLRAADTIKRADIVICENMKTGAQTMKDIGLNKELMELNVNTEQDMTDDILKLLDEGKKIALISDAGTPLFEDPGNVLVNTAISKNYNVKVVPGVTSLMTALVRCGFYINEFLYAGFLPRESQYRNRKLKELSKETRTIAILETPYRLIPVLEQAAQLMPERRAYIGMNLTMPFETHHYGTFTELHQKFKNERIKAEFVIIFEGAFPEDELYQEPDEAFEEEVDITEQVKKTFKKKTNFSNKKPGGKRFLTKKKFKPKRK